MTFKEPKAQQIPYPGRADRSIETKRKLDGGKWYNWQTALRLV